MDIDYENYNLEEKYEGSDLDIEEDYLKRLKEQRIAMLTYHKHPGEEYGRQFDGII